MIEIQAATDFVNSLITFIGAIGVLLTAITHAVALIPGDKFGSAYCILKWLSGNYGHAKNININK